MSRNYTIIQAIADICNTTHKIYAFSKFFLRNAFFEKHLK